MLLKFSVEMTSFYELKTNHLNRIRLSTCQTQYIAVTLSFPTLRICSFCAGDAGNWGSFDVAAGDLYRGGSRRSRCWWKLKLTQLLLLETVEIQRICLAYHIACDDCPHTHTPRVWKMSLFILEHLGWFFSTVMTAKLYGSNYRLLLQKCKKK